jgi:hypothetical protein
MMQEGGVILDIVLFVGICFVFGVFDLEIYFWCVVGCYSSTSRKSTESLMSFFQRKLFKQNLSLGSSIILY